MTKDHGRGRLATRRFWRSMEAAVQGRLQGKRRAKVVKTLVETVRHDAQAREDYDRTFDVLRALEGAPVAAAEYAAVEDWLLEELEFEAEAAPAAAAWWRRPWVGITAALAAAVALTIGLRGPQSTPDDTDAWGVRGSGNGGGLAIDALCPQRTRTVGGRQGLVPASEFGCAVEGTLSFAYRVDAAVPAAVEGTLSLFGVDADGDVQYYAPTPANPAGMPVQAGTWQPLPWVVELDVNHVAGDVVLYGLVSMRSPTVAEVDRLAAAVSELSPARVGDEPWHRRLAEDPALAELCADPSDCESAELSFTLHSMTSPNVQIEDQP